MQWGAMAATSSYSGEITFTLQNGSDYKWVMTGLLARSSNGNPNFASGSKTLSGELTQLRLSTVGGSDTFDNGSVSISWEF